MSPMIKQQGDFICLQGDLVFSTVADIRLELEAALKKCSSEVTIDFSNVGKVDSSALSLWLSIQRFSRQHGIRVITREVPAELNAISGIVGLDKSGLSLV